MVVVFSGCWLILYKTIIPSNDSVTTVPLKFKEDKLADRRICQWGTMFIITDSLLIRSISLLIGMISPLFGFNILDELNVPFTDVEVQVVQVGKEEVSYCFCM